MQYNAQLLTPTSLCHVVYFNCCFACTETGTFTFNRI